MSNVKVIRIERYVDENGVKHEVEHIGAPL